MKKVLTMLFNTVIAITMTSCADDITIDQPVNKKPSITIQVNQSKATTRAAYDGLDVSVTKGDVIGVYAVDKAGNIVSDNVAFTYDGKAWNAAADVPYDKSYAYYAYYPHVENPYKPDFSKKTTNEIFAQFITDTDNKFQKDDQSTLEKFTACDLMVSEPGVLSGKSTVSFSLYHKKALAILTGEGAPFTSGTYIKGDKAYFMMKPSTPTTVAGNIMQAESGKAVSKEIAYHSYSKDYLTFIPVEDCTFSFTDEAWNKESGNAEKISYSIDEGKTWIALKNNQTTPTIAAGNKILWKNNQEIEPRETSVGTVSSGWGHFTSSGIFDIEGNIMSLHFGDNFAEQKDLSRKGGAFSCIFEYTKVRNAKNLVLPATTLSTNCYGYMFTGCKAITTAPELPATTLASSCYDHMFKGCTSLTSTPELPATTLAGNCYDHMFYGCTNLSYVKMMATDISASYCLSDWLKDVSAEGTFVKAEGVEIPEGGSGIPNGWTVQETYNP